MNKTEENLLKSVIDEAEIKADALSTRINGKLINKKTNKYIDIQPKTTQNGLDIYIKENTKFGIIHLPVIISQSGLKEVVYNDFYIGKNSNVIVLAGCGIHNDLHEDSSHDGIHRFYLEENSKVKYIEKHIGMGKGEKSINPITEIYLKKGSQMNINTTQISGVNNSNRITKAFLEEDANLEVIEKILTANKEYAKTNFYIELNANNSRAHIISRSVATDESVQEFYSDIVGKTKCFAHVECDAILKDKGNVLAVPKIEAKNIEANLIHEATIGKIAGEQLIKLMSMGLTEKEAEEAIIRGFLK